MALPKKHFLKWFWPSVENIHDLHFLKIWILEKGCLQSHFFFSLLGSVSLCYVLTHFSPRSTMASQSLEYSLSGAALGSGEKHGFITLLSIKLQLVKS